MKFHWAQDKGRHFVKGQFVTFLVRGERAYGEVLQFFEKLSVSTFYKSTTMYILVHGVSFDSSALLPSIYMYSY